MADRPEDRDKTGDSVDFPEGKITPEDEGEVTFEFGISGDQVVVQLSKRVKWFAMPPEIAIEMADRIMQTAALAIANRS